MLRSKKILNLNQSKRQNQQTTNKRDGPVNRLPEHNVKIELNKRRLHSLKNSQHLVKLEKGIDHLFIQLKLIRGFFCSFQF